MRGSGSVPSSEKAALVFKANTLEFMKWHTSPQPETSDEDWAGPVTVSGTYLDTSGMKTCWGGSTLSSSIPYTATGTDIMMRLGIIDYTQIARHRCCLTSPRGSAACAARRKTGRKVR